MAERPEQRSEETFSQKVRNRSKNELLRNRFSGKNEEVAHDTNFGYVLLIRLSFYFSNLVSFESNNFGVNNNLRNAWEKKPPKQILLLVGTIGQNYYRSKLRKVENAIG